MCDVARLDRWSKPQYYDLVIGSPDDAPALVQAWRNKPARADAESGRAGTLVSLLGPAKEAVFEASASDEGPRFTVISPTLDGKYLDLAISTTWQIFGFDDDDDVKSFLALAMSVNTPVYPNEAADALELTRLHNDLLRNGFHSTDNGKPILLKHARALEVVESSDIADVDLGTVFPADLLVLQVREQERRRHVEVAEKTLTALSAGIEELIGALDESDANESRLQGVLTRFPILLGLDYRSIIPQHRLADEYVMDYALERHSGVVDLLEIEASTHILFTKSGNPRAALVHAERQVLDWLDWVDLHGEYARSRHAGLLRPVGYVVIGRRHTMSSDDRQRLIRRNLAWRGTMTVETYDDLVDRARAVRKALIQEA